MYFSKFPFQILKFEALPPLPESFFFMPECCRRPEGMNRERQVRSLLDAQLCYIVDRLPPPHESPCRNNFSRVEHLKSDLTCLSLGMNKKLDQS